MSLSLAVVGAGGVVGETIVRVLHERAIPVGDLGLFGRSARNGIRETSAEALREYEAVFFAGSEDASERYVPALLERGAVVIDNSATFRLRDGVPLIVPEINAHALRENDRLFPVGNCTAIILCMALAPVRDCAELRSVRVATYQAVSGAGRAALEEFDRGEGPFAGNVVPAIGAFGEDGFSAEERKVAAETRKVLELPELPVFATAVRVPVRTAHSEAVFFEADREVTAAELAAAFERAPGVVYHRSGPVTPRDVEGGDAVHVARLRACGPKSFALWTAGDQLRKGAATNGVQILELLLQRGLVGSR